MFVGTSLGKEKQAAPVFNLSGFRACVRTSQPFYSHHNSFFLTRRSRYAHFCHQGHEHPWTSRP